MNKKYTEQNEIQAMYDELELAGIKNNKSNFAKIFGTAVFYITLVLLLGIVVSINIDKKAGRIPDLFGIHFFEVETSSMEPTYEVGSILVSKKLTDDDVIRIDDVITFYNSSGQVVTHRVVNIVEENGELGYRTKGDNPINSIDPEILSRDDIIAILWFRAPLL